MLKNQQKSAIQFGRNDEIFYSKTLITYVNLI